MTKKIVRIVLTPM